MIRNEVADPLRRLGPYAPARPDLGDEVTVIQGLAAKGDRGHPRLGEEGVDLFDEGCCIAHDAMTIRCDLSHRQAIIGVTSPYLPQYAAMWDTQTMGSRVDIEHLKGAIQQALEEDGRTPKGVSKAIRKRFGEGGETLIRDILQGKSKNPKLRTILMIAEELGRPPQFFLGEPLTAGLDNLPSEESFAEVLRVLVEVYMEAEAQEIGLQAAAGDLRAWLALYLEEPESYADRSGARLAARAITKQSQRRPELDR